MTMQFGSVTLHAPPYASRTIQRLDGMYDIAVKPIPTEADLERQDYEQYCKLQRSGKWNGPIPDAPKEETFSITGLAPGEIYVLRGLSHIDLVRRAYQLFDNEYAGTHQKWDLFMDEVCNKAPSPQLPQYQWNDRAKELAKTSARSEPIVMIGDACIERSSIVAMFVVHEATCSFVYAYLRGTDAPVVVKLLSQNPSEKATEIALDELCSQANSQTLPRGCSMKMASLPQKTFIRMGRICFVPADFLGAWVHYFQREPNQQPEDAQTPVYIRIRDCPKPLVSRSFVIKDLQAAMKYVEEIQIRVNTFVPTEDNVGFVSTAHLFKSDVTESKKIFTADAAVRGKIYFSQKPEPIQADKKANGQEKIKKQTKE